MPTKKPKTKKPSADKKPEMKVAPEIVAALSALRARSEAIVSELGRMEVRKNSYVAEVLNLNNRSNALLKQERERMGIPEGVQFSISPDGDVEVKD